VPVAALGVNNFVLAEMDKKPPNQNENMSNLIQQQMPITPIIHPDMIKNITNQIFSDMENHLSEEEENRVDPDSFISYMDTCGNHDEEHFRQFFEKKIWQYSS